MIGAGIGGLSAAAALHQRGWDVTVCERATALEPIGVGLAVAPNGLRALDTIGAGAVIRALAVSQELGIRRRDGRWLLRSSSQALAARFGDPVVLVTRADLVEAVRSRVPAPAVAARDGAVLVAGKLTPNAALRGLAFVYDWLPPPGPA